MTVIILTSGTKTLHGKFDWKRRQEIYYNKQKWKKNKKKKNKGKTLVQFLDK